MSALIQVKDDGTFRRLSVDQGPPPLGMLQELVDGYVQVVYAPAFVVLVNEDGRLHKRFRPNVHIDNLLAAHGVTSHPIVGAAVIAISGSEDLLPLPDALADDLIDELCQFGCMA